MDFNEIQLLVQCVLCCVIQNVNKNKKGNSVMEFPF